MDKYQNAWNVLYGTSGHSLINKGDLNKNIKKCIDKIYDEKQWDDSHIQELYPYMRNPVVQYAITKHYKTPKEVLYELCDKCMSTANKVLLLKNGTLPYSFVEKILMDKNVRDSAELEMSSSLKKGVRAFSDNAIKIMLNKYSAEMGHIPYAYASEKDVLEKINTSDNLDEMMPMILSNIHLLESQKDKLYHSIDADFDIFEIVNPSPDVIKDRLDSILLSFEEIKRNEDYGIKVPETSKLLAHISNQLMRDIDEILYSEDDTLRILNCIGQFDLEKEKYCDLNDIVRMIVMQGRFPNVAIQAMEQFGDLADYVFYGIEKKYVSQDVLEKRMHMMVDKVKTYKNANFEGNVSALLPFMRRISDNALEDFLSLNRPELVKKMMIYCELPEYQVNRILSSMPPPPRVKLYAEILKNKNIPNKYKSYILASLEYAKKDSYLDVLDGNLRIDVKSQAYLPDITKEELEVIINELKNIRLSTGLGNDVLPSYITSANKAMSFNNMLSKFGLLYNIRDNCYRITNKDGLLDKSEVELRQLFGKMEDVEIENLLSEYRKKYMDDSKWDCIIDVCRNADRYKTLFDYIEKLTKERDHKFLKDEEWLLF